MLNQMLQVGIVVQGSAQYCTCADVICVLLTWLVLCTVFILHAYQTAQNIQASI